MHTRKYRKIETPETEEKKGGGANRVRFLVFFVLIGGLGILVRLYVVQVRSHDVWETAATGQYSGERNLKPERGEVFFRDGESGLYSVAVNRDEPYVYIVPREMDRSSTQAEALASVLSLDRDTVWNRVNREGDPYELLKKRIAPEEVDRVKELGIKGVYIASEKYRYYPAGEFAAPLIGFTGFSEKNQREEGKYGIEVAFDDGLRGTAGKVREERDAGGRWISLTDREFTPAKNGDSYVLTIDRNIQFETERILKEALELYGAESGSIVVMDPKTGDLLSLVTLPQFDPNRYRETEDYTRFLNTPTSVAYESGSVMKPITMAMGIEEGKVNPDTEYVDTGVILEAGFPIRNAEDKTYGRSTMTKVLDESINTGMIYVERLVGNEKFRDYLKNFGFGEKAGFGFPAEVNGSLKNLSDTRLSRNIEFFTASFGQGITVSLLQLVRAYSVFGNGGILMQPRLVEKVIYSDGTEEVFRPEQVRRVVSEETAVTMGRMLRSVVVNGHGKQADVPGYLVGGKTGTAQVAKKDEKGYDEFSSIGSFAGYAPINDPRFAIAVKIDNPKNAEWAESSAAPVFGKVMKFLLEYAQIEPTESVKKK